MNVQLHVIFLDYKTTKGIVHWTEATFLPDVGHMITIEGQLYRVMEVHWDPPSQVDIYLLKWGRS